MHVRSLAHGKNIGHRSYTEVSFDGVQQPSSAYSGFGSEDSLQTKTQEHQKHDRPEIEAFVEDVFMIEVKGNHCKTDSNHKSRHRQPFWFFEQ